VTAELPLWVDVLTAALVVTGAVAALLGSVGLVRLPTFFQRIHAPTLAATFGTWAQSFVQEQLFVHALLIAIFIALTAPVTTIFLMRAALFRRRTAGEDAPRPVAG
jgi:multicomponent K+:H+ antiporter subunit G